jgi:hypothetical protein
VDSIGKLIRFDDSCPFNILFGKQTGNLASEEDKTAWANRCNGAAGALCLTSSRE